MTDARTQADLANAKYAVQLEYAEGIARGTNVGVCTGYAYAVAPTVDYDGSAVGGKIMTAEEYYNAIAEALNITNSQAKSQYVVTVDESNGTPLKVELKK